MSSPLDPFAHALKAFTEPAPAAMFRTWNGSDPGARLAVYRNNVWGSLVRVLAESFPVVRALVGEDFFAAMARDHVAGCWPTSPVLTQYGGNFPAFIRSFAPAASLPYLADVARLEWARIQAYHAADVAALGVPTIAAHLARPETLPRAVLGLHPGVGVVVSEHPVVAIWAAHQGTLELAEVALEHAENALIFRALDEPLVQVVSQGMAAFVSALQIGRPLGEAVAAGGEQQVQDAEPFDLAQALALLLRHQLICSWSFHD